MQKKLLKRKITLIKKANKYFSQLNLKKAIIGISGGIDSAVSLNLLIDIVGRNNIYAYFINIQSDIKDINDAKRICKDAKVKLNLINLNKSFLTIKKDFKENSMHALGNIKSRMRMMFLYNEALKHNGLVIGNSNLDEIYLGYFTKYGDSGCDVFLLNTFNKSEIYELADHYNINESIINKAPSAGLLKNQTDEKDMGIKYIDIDKFLTKKLVDKDTKIKILKLHNKNKHKLIYNYIINNPRKFK